MDIAFHYFAVKSVARASGYQESQAQRIATFSQFIDDYNWYVYFRSNNIPKYIKSNDLDIVFNEFLNIINPVTTGFSDWFDIATLILERSQKFTVSPFHFIPQNAEKYKSGNYRTVPATLNDGSYISTMLDDLKNSISAGLLSENDAYMKMGMLMHTFADTYAHQLFTGYHSSLNSVKLTRVTNNITGKDETDTYHFFIEQWIARIEKIINKKIPTIGHMAIAHVPDLTHLSFEIEYPDLDGNHHTYGRSNTSEFVKTCEEIYTFFRSCLGDNVKADMSWDDLAPKLAQGFLIDVSKELNDSEATAVKALIPYWSSIFPNYTYAYNSDQIKASFILNTSKEDSAEVMAEKTRMVDGVEVSMIGKSYTDDFYKYNFFADKHLITLYSAHPRNFSSEANEEVAAAKA